MKLKYITLIVLMVIIFQNTYSQQNLNGWYWLNNKPQGGTIEWIKIIDPTHYYAVGDYGTFMKSSDGGDSWIINSQGGFPDPFFNSGGTLDLLTAWFFDANTGLVGGKNANDTGSYSYIKRTTDGGNTFIPVSLNNGSPFGMIRDFYFLDANTGFLCGNSNVNIMKTTNGGLNWSNLPGYPVAGYDYTCIYAKDVNNLIVGTATDGTSRKIIRTTNGGNTWFEEDLPGTTIVTVEDIDFQNANTGFVSGIGSYFAYTTNGGVNWTQAIFPVFQTNLNDIKIIGSTVYVMSEFNSYYYTSNLGVTWDSSNVNDPSNLYQPYNNLGYTFDISGSDVIVAGLNGKLSVSNDNGVTWRNKNYSVGDHEDNIPCIFALPGSGEIWAGSEFLGRVLHSTNNGVNWSVQQTTANTIINDLVMVTTEIGYFTGGNPFNGQGGKTYRTIDGGTNWVQLNIPNPNQPLYEIDFVDIYTGWVFGGLYNGGAIISKTTNAGVTWVSQSTAPISNNVIPTGDMSDANNGYCASAANVFKTTNGGLNWNVLNTPPQGLVICEAVKTFSANNVYLAGEHSIFKSSNGGATWNEKVLELGTVRGMDWADMNNGTIVGVQGFTAKTTDGGSSWTYRNAGTSTIKGVSMSSPDSSYISCNLNDYGAILRLYDVNTSVTLNLKVGIQGFWNGSTQVSDTVVCHLMNSASPFAEVEATSAVLNSNGQANFVFNSAPSGNYYIKITHRNSLETWSAVPVAVTTGGSFNYDFTTSASQAYGNNMILTSGRYCDYSGDVTQEGSVDLNDVVNVNNASSVFTTGYVVQDVTGDNLVDLSDLIITFNNAANFVVKVTP